MGKKRDKSTEIVEEENINSSDESMGDTDEEITFQPMTKEERRHQEELYGNITDDENDEDNEEENEEGDNDIIDIDFGFSDPKPAHFKSIRNFMRYLLLGAAKDVDFSPLADAVVNQVEAGSIVEVNDQEDAYAFLTALHLQFHKNNPTIKAILSILRKRCPENQRTQFDQYLSKQTGLLLNERMRNFPPQVIPPLYDSLEQDIQWALKNSDTKSAFKFDYLLVIAPCYYDPHENKSKKAKLEEEEEALYFHFEDEILKKYAEFTFSFGVGQLGDEELSETLRQSRLIMIIPFAKFHTIVKEIQQVPMQYNVC